MKQRNLWNCCFLSIIYNGTGSGTSTELTEPSNVGAVPLVPRKFRFQFRSKCLILRDSSVSSAFPMSRGDKYGRKRR
jgi:hypothetical protein